MTKHNDWVLDPFAGAGTTMAAAVKHGRRGAGAELVGSYNAMARERITAALNGDLKVRPMNTPIYDPQKAGNSLRVAPWLEPLIKNGPVYSESSGKQFVLLEKEARLKTRAVS